MATAPVWLNPSEFNESHNDVFYLGIVSAGNEISVPLHAVDPEDITGVGNTLEYTGDFSNLPGLSINASTGVISGFLIDSTHQLIEFNVTVTSLLTSLSTTRTFSFNANQVNTYSLTWVTPEGSLGSIKEGEKSLFSVAATSNSPWIRYFIVDPNTHQELLVNGYPSNPLPAGLELNTVTGEIFGMAQNGITTSPYEFTVKAQNESFETFRTFSITLENRYNAGSTRAFATLYGPDRVLWNDLFTTSEITETSIFREADPQFGVVKQPKILLVENLNWNSTLSFEEYKNQIMGVLNGSRRTYLDLGHVEVAQVFKNDEVLYEVLYRRIFDENDRIDLSNYALTTVSNSFRNLRNKLLTQIGNSGTVDVLPDWMNNKWLAAIPFVHVKPGLGQAIADKINSNDKSLQKSYMQRVRVDRIVIEPTADDSFMATNVLFDAKY